MHMNTSFMEKELHLCNTIREYPSVFNSTALGSIFATLTLKREIKGCACSWDMKLEMVSSQDDWSENDADERV